MNNLSGKVLGNRYILLEKIGDGGMALVYKARCQLLNRFVAVKILRPEFTADEDFVKKFKRESLAAASLSHPNIVGIYDVGQQDNIYYIVMEYINGQTLKDYIRKRGKIDYKETLIIANQIAKALDNAHKNGVVHRDIKPHNILITDDKIVKVTDFGIARASSSSTVTNMGNVMGSAHYFSPEQAKGVYTDHRTDIYSLGVVMYEMLTGRLPFDADSPITVAIKHIQDSFVEPKSIDPLIPKAVNDIVIKAMQKDINKRYQNSMEILKDIEIALKDPEANLIVDDSDLDDVTKVIPVNEINDVLSKNKGKKNKSSRKKLIPILLSFVIMASLLLIVGYWYKNYFVVKDVKVPPIVGLDESQGKIVLDSKNLKMEIIDKQESNRPVGEILSVDPSEGSTVKENATVKVTISAGLKKVLVPDVRNLDQANAEELLKRNGLELGNIDRRNSNDVVKDLILDQNPSKGVEVTKGTKVDIVISDGQKVTFVTVPLLIGRTLDEAEKLIRDANLNLGKIATKSDPGQPDGVVIDQDIAPNIQVKQNETINIVVNKIEGNTSDETNQNNNSNQ